MNKTSLSTSIILFVLAIALLGAAVINGNQKKDDDQKTLNTVQSIQEQLDPYHDKDTMQKLVLVENFKNSATLGDSENIPSAKITKDLVIKGTIVGGYLYIVADANGKALSTNDPGKFDDVYINLIELGQTETTAKEYGGHLVESRSLATPQSDSQTELLFPLSNVVYLKSYLDSAKEVLSANWLEIFNDKTSRERLVSFSSTLKQGTIQQMVIYYKCLENSECSISAK